MTEKMPEVSVCLRLPCEIEEGLNLDLDKNGKLVGIEVLDATERYSLADIFNISTENLILEEKFIGPYESKSF